MIIADGTAHISEEQRNRKPWLGLYMIVRDAEKTISTLLKSIEGVFDEVVIVDTGSTDNTKKIIEECLKCGAFPNEGRYIGMAGLSLPADGPRRLVLANFAWVDDFAAARQFAYELGTAKWRCYLDADDDASDFQKKLRPTLERTEKTHPESNCISVKYDYVPNEMAQDTIRIVRWDAGWRWSDPVHEHLVRTDENSGRVISKYTDIWVRHQPHEPQKHANASFERNVRIAEKAYQTATKPTKEALWAYYLGNYAYEVGRIDLARRYYREMADGLGRNNITCEGLCRWARMEMKQGNYERAMDLAGEAIAKAPELPDGYATMGVALNLAGAPYRAAGLFDFLKAQPKPPLETQHDATWLDGITNGHAAQAYYQIGRVSDANLAIAAIPEGLLTHPEVIAASRPTHTSLTKTEGFSRLRALWEFLIWDTEPLKAKRLLEEFCPAALSDSPQVKDLLRKMGPKLAHMDSWESYQRAYASIPELPYHVPKEHHAWTLTQGRARMVRQWAEAMPKEGPPVEVLVIGVQDGIIETAMMEANPRIVLTACDVAPQASVGIQEMQVRFPGRVKSHRMAEDHFDWFPDGSEFDAVILFEVLEHLPDTLDRDAPGDYHAIDVIRRHLKQKGKLFLSTPIASAWVEEYLGKLEDPRPWWHVRAHNPTSLWKLLQERGFTGSLIGLGEESLFLAMMTFDPPSLEQCMRPLPRAARDVAIWVYPQRPTNEGFDPFSPKHGHVGGSEEAVIHLSAALARKGCRVTVYTDSPRRQDQVFVHEGVQWCPLSGFDAPSLEGSLLVWRAPQMAAQFQKQTRAKVLNWLHDTHYNAKPEIYDAADGTIVLSKFHAEAVKQLDGYQGKFSFASNGIDPKEFPEPNEAKRDTHAAIYAAAPERGLELLLEAWPTIRKAVPDATLRVYYSWVLTEKMLKQRPNADLTALLAKLRAGLEALKDQGVTYLGGVDHKTLNEAYRTSGVWTFPPERFNEIACISALRAQASGCWPVIIPTGALPETCPFGTHIFPRDAADYAGAVIRTMLNPPLQVERSKMRAWALEQTWDKAAGQFIEAITAKNERITIYAGGFGRRFDALGSADGKPLGGSEEAVIAMARALADQGKEVVVYAPLPEHRLAQVMPSTGQLLAAYGVTWLDSTTFDPAGPHGTLLAWRCPALLPKLKGNGCPVILWLMDPEYGTGSYDYSLADDVVFLTEAHKDIIRRKDGYDGGGQVVPIGLPQLPALSLIERKPHEVMWATSPDRGLLEFLREVWPQVLKEVPGAKLHIFYGLEPLERGGKKKLAQEIEEEIGRFQSNEVEYHGGVPDAELYEWYQRCSVFAYKCVGFEETQSLALCKALALGCYPAVNAVGCLTEVVVSCGGLVFEDAAYTRELVSALKTPATDGFRTGMAERARREFSVDSMVEKMLKVIEGVQ